LAILPRGRNSWILLSNNIAPILATRNLKIYARYAGLKDILVCNHYFGELYEHVVTCLGAMVNAHVCPDINESRWTWDRETKTTGHGMKSILQHFGVIVGLTVLKNSLDYLIGLSTELKKGILTSLSHIRWLTIWNQRFNVRGMALV